MQIKIKRFMVDPEEVDFFDFAQRCLSGDDPERGELETIKASLENISRSVSSLTELLIEKNIISVEEGLLVVDRWWSTSFDKIIK